MNNNLINEIQTDFLIIGSGLSGLYSAIYASNFGTVTLVTKSSIQESNSYWAQGGIAAALDKNDSTEIHMQDTISVGCGLNNEEAVDIMVSEGLERVLELINQGMNFKKNSSLELIRNIAPITEKDSVTMIKGIKLFRLTERKVFLNPSKEPK